MKIKKLILKFVLFIVLFLSTFYFAIWKLSQGQVDYFYSKFTHQASSLVIGVSTGCDGISPSVIEKNFENEIELPMLNFCFAAQISDYGPIYLNAIQNKIKPGTKNGLFILDVEPPSLSIYKSQPDSINTLLQQETLLADMKHFNQDPAFEYIRKHYTHSLYQGFNRDRKIEEYRFAHANGWQEVIKKNEFYEFSDSLVLMRTYKRIEEARKIVGRVKPSEVRLQYLDKTIDYLKKYGEVYLVRVPIHNYLLEIADWYWPDFNDQMEKIAASHKITYLDYSKDSEQYEFYDGSHLFGHSAKKFTQKLCDDIKALDKNIRD